VKLKNSSPPKSFLRFFQWFCHPKLRDTIEGDLIELHEELTKEKGKRKADIKFIMDVLLLFRPGIIKPIRRHKNLNTFGMYKSYFRIGWRSMAKNSTFYVVNIFGLAIGLACCLLIGAYIYSELTYDTYPKNAKDIYRVEVHALGNGKWAHYSSVDFGVGPGIASTYSEVVSFTRLDKWFQPYLRYKENVFKEQNIAVVDSNFLQFFSIPLIAGDDRTALVKPNTMVVTKAFAQKYFGNEDPIGKALTIQSPGELLITGLIDDVPEQSHFHFDAFISGSTFKNRRESWSNIGDFTYVQLNKNSNPNELQTKFPDLVMKYVVPEIQQDMGVTLAEAQKSKDTFVFSLQPLSKIHLYSHNVDELGANGDIKYVYIFTALAIFILLLACVNFVNLSTATSAKRAREVGIRKVMGSIKTQLISQFLVESIMVAGSALIFAYGVVMAVLPFFNELTGKSTSFWFFLEPVTLLAIISGVTLVGIIAGIYPSFFLSSFNTISVLKGTVSGSSGNRNVLRSGLVVFQFAVSTSLIVATMVVYQQLNFMQNKELGYNKDQVLVIHETQLLRKSEKTFKEQLLKDSRVISASVSRQVPGQKDIDGTQAFPKDREKDETSAEIHINIYHVDYDYLTTLGMQVANGRNFSLDFPSDSSGIVINETAAKEFGWTTETSIGKSIVASGQREFHVVGVVKDFNYASVRQKIAPLVMVLSRHSGLILVKVNASDIKNVITDVKRQWASLNPDAAFSYSFLDEQFSALYFAEERTGKIFITFATIALIIAGLGLFGLSTFSAQQRTKEIGIRKVLGATASEVLYMLSKQFLTLVLVAFIISMPIISWIMNQWLEDFAYRVNITWWIFLMAGVLSFAIAFFSMSFQAIRAALANPVQSLKVE
jgi:putative ABC transport system permease protein